jgi:CheY-like chemotaxis protein
MPIHSEMSSGPPPFLREERPVRILVAEDPFIGNFLRTVLQRHGHTVVTGEPDQASELLRAGGVQAKVVITNRPEAFLPFAGSLGLLYIAANPDPELTLQFPACRVLRKPFRNDELLEAVEQLAQLAVA